MTRYLMDTNHAAALLQDDRPGRDFMFGRGGADTFYSRDGISGNDVITGNDPTVQPGDVAFTDIDGEDEVLGVEQEVRGNP